MHLIFSYSTKSLKSLHLWKKNFIYIYIFSHSHTIFYKSIKDLNLICTELSGYRKHFPHVFQHCYRPIYCTLKKTFISKSKTERCSKKTSLEFLAITRHIPVETNLCGWTLLFRWLCVVTVSPLRLAVPAGAFLRGTGLHCNSRTWQQTRTHSVVTIFSWAMFLSCASPKENNIKRKDLRWKSHETLKYD